MARKINVKLIMELRDAGLSRSAIASTRHISRHSVSEVFNIADEKGIHYDDIRALDDSEVYRMFYPEKFANETMYGDPDYEHVHQELKKVGVTLKLLHEEYVDRCERNGEIPMGKTKFNEGYAEFTVTNPRFTRTVVPRGTPAHMHPNEAYELIRDNEVRDEQIISDVKECILGGRTPVVLSKYKDHSEKLYERLKECADKVFLMTGNNSKKEHMKIREQLQWVDTKETLILVATGSLIGEGFDFPRLDTLIMATPVSFRSVVEQYAGRLNRDYDGKTNVIVYDYVDSHIPMFDKMYAKRLKAYKQIGYEVCGGLQHEKQTANAIFDSGNYQEVYKRDLLEAEKEIVISSPAISGSKVYELINLLKEKQTAGVKITVVTWEPDSYGYGDPAFWMSLHEEMIQAGFCVKTVEEFCEHFAIIDQEIVWYGNMNLLAKETLEDSMMRINGKKIAAELMELTFG